jgi:uncharacterized membrane protein (DUF4010 family)
MDILEHLEPWWRFAVALLIGALIGLEREFVQQKRGDPDFAGIRTFALIALFGAVAGFFAELYGILIFVAAYLGIVLLTWASYLGDIYRGVEEGITTEVVALLVPFLGAMVVWGFGELAAALGVVSAFVLALKPTLHGLARRMSTVDLRATLEFALITAVVLPILPNQNFGPFDVLNPYQIWLLVVLVSGISFFGYILMQVLGTERGVGVVGLLGGLVSSTAVTLSFSGRSKESPKLSPVFAIAIVLASSVMFPRVLVEVLAVNPDLLSLVGIPIISMLGAGVIGIVILWQRQRAIARSSPEVVELKNPLKLTTAITFGVLFALVLLLVRSASEFFGNAGVFIASVLAGLADVDAITLSASNLAAAGEMEPEVAAGAIVTAAVVNTLVKAVTASFLGSPALRRVVWWVFAMILLAGIVTGLLTLVF